MASYWYKEAIIYEVHVKSYFDSSGDGIGDFKGLTQKLDYLQNLGVSALWLLPFFPSPLKDDGYDIASYDDIHPNYGSLKDFKEFLREAHMRNLKVIIELVINHTSDQHPWFQRERREKKGDFYVWSDTPEKYKEARIIFEDFESSNWTWDREAQSYFWHRFYSHQPDLNYENPAVHRAVLRILSFWFKMGVDGVRLDAIPYLYEKEGTTCENLPETHRFLKKLRAYVDQHFKDKMLLAEANQWPEEAASYFGKGDECHMAFHFPVMPRLFMAIQMEDSLPIVDIMAQTPAIPSSCQWALFLRNHDELTLEMVTDEERDYMFRVYADEPQARVNLGIRRRLAPLLKNDRRKIELMNALLFSLTGTPVLYYGDEIGMGDNIYLGDRNGVRTPMQWSSDRNAGFSRANPQRLYLPPIIDPEYHYETVNVEAAVNNPYSLFWWTKQLIALRKRYKALSYGTTEFLVAENRKVLVYFRSFEEELLMIIVNLSRYAQYVELDLQKYNGYSLIEMFSQERFPSIGELPYFLTLGSYGYYWFSLEKKPLEKRAERIEVAPLIYKGDIKKIFAQEKQIIGSMLRKYLLQQRGFYEHLPKMAKLGLVDQLMLGKDSYLLIMLLTEHTGILRYFPLYVTLRRKQGHEEGLIGYVKEKEGEWAIVDSGNDPLVHQVIIDLIQQQKKYKSDAGSIEGKRFLSVGDQSILRLMPFLEEEMDADIEVRLFLMEQQSFKGYFPLMGYLEYKRTDQSPLVLAEIDQPQILELNALSAFTELAGLSLQRQPLEEMVHFPKKSLIHLAFGSLSAECKEMTDHLEFTRLLGEVTAEFHMAMISDLDNPDFSPVPYTLFHQRSLFQVMRRKFIDGFAKLKQYETCADMFQLQERIYSFLSRFPENELKTGRIRIHGSYILDNLHYTGKGFVIANFGRHPQLSLAESKYKRSNVRDIAAMCISMTQASFEATDRIRLRGLIGDHELDTAYHWALIWAISASSSFIRSYMHKLEGTVLGTQSRSEADFLIGTFIIERCLDLIGRSEESKVKPFCFLIKYLLPIYESIACGD